jgi:hypothetical protein
MPDNKKFLKMLKDDPFYTWVDKKVSEDDKKNLHDSIESIGKRMERSLDTLRELLKDPEERKRFVKNVDEALDQVGKTEGDK